MEAKEEDMSEIKIRKATNNLNSTHLPTKSIKKVEEEVPKEEEEKTDWVNLILQYFIKLVIFLGVYWLLNKLVSVIMSFFQSSASTTVESIAASIPNMKKTSLSPKIN